MKEEFFFFFLPDMGELLLINKWLIQKKNHLTQKQYKINSNLHLIS
jgi:hypothetical protein